LKGNDYSDKKDEQPPMKRGGPRWGVLCGKVEYTEGVEGAQNENERPI
jgi:hypothetical protein